MVGDFYKSKKWEKLIERLRLERVSEDGTLYCEECGAPIVKKYDCIGHHKIELTEANVDDVTISLNPDNIKLIHHKCHNRIHKRFEGFTQRVFLIYGSPCSGKSTWVKNNANNDDLIIDIDAIWECICFSDKYHKPNKLKANAFAIRDCLMEQVMMRKGKWLNAYIVGGYPLASDRQRISTMLGAEQIFIDETEETCLSRCKNEDWEEYVRNWFETYTA